ncbi:head decoration protein [Cryobacterium cryoconiti]|uniref:Head decoration protein n=1 Tax=Cryobacterium cryoconiti TaxID=1259239 RepID=A0A4Y8JY41_9MICO|nr:head decoration protein [Cryobacterium cryoconiti]TFD27515.1 head decoration protein [Cryobacterium cryoconiti]
MTDISVVTTTSQVENRSWLLSPHGTEPGTTPSITVDVSTFTAGTHYPNGYIPSGIVLAKITASGLYGPYDSTALDGRQITTDGRIGLLYGSLSVKTGSTKVGGALVVHGFVNAVRLPFQAGSGGITAAAKTALSLIHFSA